MPAIKTAMRYSCKVSPCHLSLGALAQISGSSLLMPSKQHRVVMLQIYIKQTSPSALASQTLMAGSGSKPVRNISNLITEKMLLHRLFCLDSWWIDTGPFDCCTWLGACWFEVLFCSSWGVYRWHASSQFKGKCLCTYFWSTQQKQKLDMISQQLHKCTFITPPFF